MALTIDLSKIGQREKLKPKKGDEPHWQRLRIGCYVGYRPSRREGRGTWFARAYDGDRGKNQLKRLGDYGSLTGHDVFNQAKSDAEAWADLVHSGGVQQEKLKTVGDACRAYLLVKPGKIAEGVFRRHVFADAVAKVQLDKLRRHHLQQWRARLEEAPAMVSRSKKGEKRTKRRAPSTVNRDMTPLRAALKRVLRDGPPNTDAAWQEALRPVPNSDMRREIYLDRSERQRLLEHASDEIRPLLRAWCLLPLRPGAAAALKVRAFDKRSKTLTIEKDKNGRPRQISVGAVAADFLEEQAKGKKPNDPLFAGGDGKPWNKDRWKRPVKQAVVSAGLPQKVTAYTLRHCVITDLVMNRLPILTVAQISGTSVAMIEKHYGHLVGDDAATALEALAL